MRKFLIKVGLIFALTTAGISAQVKGSGNDVVEVGPVTGVESAAATCEMSVAMCFGNTYVLNSFGEWESHHLTVSLNYFNSLPNGGFGFTVTGGNWSLVVMRENQYAGTLYGKVTSGSIVYPPTDEEKSKKIINVDLQATGGLGIFKKKSRKKIKATLEMSANLSSGEISGRLTFTN